MGSKKGVIKKGKDRMKYCGVEINLEVIHIKALLFPDVKLVGRQRCAYI